jgi:predicted transposase/invertase (TIGR01784 family)
MELKETHYVNPFLDSSFKRIFGQEANKSLLIDFLNNLLVGERHIVDLVYRDKEQISESKIGHSTIYDICCQTDTGEYIIVEMQNQHQPQFITRTIYYAAQAIERQGNVQAKWHYDVKAVYCIAFMNFTDPNLAPKLRVDAVLCDRETGKQISDVMRFVYLQLPFFDKEADECETFFERWIYVLRNMEVLDDLPKAFQCEAFKKLKEVSDVAMMSEDERIAYERVLREYRDTSMMYENAINKGVNKGYVKGLAEGRAEWHQKAIQSARVMKSLGASIETIKESTGLTDEEISAL